MAPGIAHPRRRRATTSLSSRWPTAKRQAITSSSRTALPAWRKLLVAPTSDPQAWHWRRTEHCLSRTTCTAESGASPIKAVPGSTREALVSARVPAPGSGPHDARRPVDSLPLPPGVTREQLLLGDHIFHGEAAGGNCSGCHSSDGKGSVVGSDLTPASGSGVTAAWMPSPPRLLGACRLPSAPSAPCRHWEARSSRPRTSAR